LECSFRSQPESFGLSSGGSLTSVFGAIYQASCNGPDRPKGLIENIDESIRAGTLKGKRLSYIETGRSPRLPAEILQGPTPPHMISAPDIVWPQRSIYELEEVEVIGGYSAALITSNSQLIGELSPDVFGARNHELFGRFKTPKPTKLSGRSLLLATPEAAGNFSHWLFDLLPRLSAVEAAGQSLSTFDHYIVNSYQAGFQIDSLNTYGIPKERIHLLGPKDAFSCESVCLSNLRQDHWKESLNPSDMEQVREKLLSQSRVCTQKYPKRIWLSRKDVPFRRLLNEAELEPLLSKYGFETFIPEQFSLREQAEAFRNADIIAGPHTSAMCNWMYCKEGTPVIEIASPYHKDISFWTIASHAKLHYTALLGEVDSKNNSTIGTRFIDFRVDPDRLEHYLLMFTKHESRAIGGDN